MPAVASAGDLRAGEAKGRAAAAGGRAFIREHKLNESTGGDLGDIGIIVMGGLTNSCCARWSGWDWPTASAPRAFRCWCSTWSIRWCRRRSAHSAPANARARRRGRRSRLHRAGDQCRTAPRRPANRPCSARAAADGRRIHPRGAARGPRSVPAGRAAGRHRRRQDRARRAASSRHGQCAAALGAVAAAAADVLHRLPGAAGVLGDEASKHELGPMHVSCRHRLPSPSRPSRRSAWATRSSATACRWPAPRRSAPAVRASAPISIMGDGGFWHNGLHHRRRECRVQQRRRRAGRHATTAIPRPPARRTFRRARPATPAAARASTSRRRCAAMGVTWLRTVRTYGVGDGQDAEGGAAPRRSAGLKVIIADGECQLARQRRVRPRMAKRRAGRARDCGTASASIDEICTGDHSCIRLSGCPSLTVSPSPIRCAAIRSPRDRQLRRLRPVRRGRHAAVLCPSFYRAEIVRNPTGGTACAALRARADRVGRRRDAGGRAMSPHTTLPVRPVNS